MKTSSDFDDQLNFGLSNKTTRTVGIVVLGPIEKTKNAVTAACKKIELTCAIISADKIPNYDEYNEYRRLKSIESGKPILQIQALLSYCGLCPLPQVIVIENIESVQSASAHIIKTHLLDNHFDEDAETLKEIRAVVMLADSIDSVIDINKDIQGCTAFVIDGRDID